MNQIEDRIVEACARAAHEANRAYCIAIGDASQVAWKDAPEWQRASARDGVRGAIAGATPRQSHENWSRVKLADGWRHGVVKDPTAKTHPCLVPYDELPEEQQRKDFVFINTVRPLAMALGAIPMPPPVTIETPPTDWSAS